MFEIFRLLLISGIVKHKITPIAGLYLKRITYNSFIMKKEKELENLRKLFAKKIWTLRTLNNLTQEEIGARSGISYKYIGEIERGEVNPSLDVLGKIAQGFNTTLKDLMDFSESKDGLHKENMFYSLSKSACETVRKALTILQKFFKNIKSHQKDEVL